MKKEKLNVGAKFGTEHFAVEVDVQIPETQVEMQNLALHGRSNVTTEEQSASIDFCLQMFNRGWRIWNQEQSGARDVVKGASVEERKNVPALTAKVQKIVNDADPLAPAKRTGRPAKPAEAVMTDEIAKAMKKGDTATLASLLAAQGIKINFSAEQK